MIVRGAAATLALGLAAVAACSAPATAPDLVAAEMLERQGKDGAALIAYRNAERSCRAEPEAYRRRLTCSQAYLGRAELLATLGRTAEAAAAFERIPAALPDDRATIARAVLRAGELRLAGGEAAAGYRHLWRVVTDFPDEPVAADALKTLLADGRRRDAAALERELGRLVGPLAGTRTVDNVQAAIADLAEARGDLAAARTALDALVAGSPTSGLVDDALWHAARLSRALGDGPGAARRLERLQATREVAWGTGSYFSVWLDDGLLELGRVRRDLLRDLAGALEAFARLPRDYPTSTLHDDALWETARTYAMARDPARACRVLGDLARRFPDSRWQLGAAPELARALGCRR